MSLDWKLQHGLGNRPYKRMLFPAISLLLHGAVFLAIETYWVRSENQPLPTKSDAPIPVKFIEVPANKVAPPKDTKQIASTNSRSGGKARPELPIATRALPPKPTTPLPSRQPLTQAKLLTPQPSQDALPPQQLQPAPRRHPVPLKVPKPKISPPVARIPKAQSNSSPPPRQHASLLDGYAKPDRHSFISTRIDHLPNANRPNANRLAPDSSPNISPPVEQTLPRVQSSRRQIQGQHASLLGGPVSLNHPWFTSERLASLSNADRPTPSTQGVDARQDIVISPYLHTLRSQVANHWHPELSNSSAKTIIGFSISRAGQISDLRLIKTSGSTVSDEAALKAVQRAAPFKPLPNEFPAAQLNILFTFDLNIFTERESGL